jgi:hypothetical protein
LIGREVKMTGRSAAIAPGVLLACLVFPSPGAAQSPSTGAGPAIEVGAKIGLYKNPGSVPPLQIGPMADLTVWTASGFGVNVAVEYYRGTVAYFRFRSVPILGSVLHRLSGNRLQPYLGVGGGMHLLKVANLLDAAHSESRTALAAHGVVGVEPALPGRVKLVVEARFGFFRARAGVPQDASYSMGVVTAAAGVRF